MIYFPENIILNLTNNIYSQENRFLIFLYFALLLVVFIGTIVGATITYFQNLDVIKTPLLNSMSKYDPDSTDPEIVDVNAAWDDVQAEVRPYLWRLNDLKRLMFFAGIGFRTRELNTFKSIYKKRWKGVFGFPCFTHLWTHSP